MWIVVLRSSSTYCYGPFIDPDAAHKFAEFLTAEVDPATVHQVRSPVNELLTWREHIATERT